MCFIILVSEKDRLKEYGEHTVTLCLVLRHRHEGQNSDITSS